MNSFEQWVKSSSNLGLTRYGDQLIAIGATWDTFRRDSNEVILDLCKEGGIPKLVAHDIFTAVSEALQGMSRPLAIFWDIENVPIPTDWSGKEIISKIKSILLAHGQIVCFRAYASIGLNQIPEEKRSELQLSGCHLVDCPHNGRKEVADKMIIVDSMEFAYNNLDGASLCFITSDVDYAYLLSKLNKPHCKTIVISRQSRSDTHVIGMRKTLPVIPPGFVNCVSKSDTVVVEPTGGSVNNRNSSDIENGSCASKVCIGLESDQKQEETFDEPSSNKGNFDLLCSLIEKYVDVGHTGGGTLKCHVASILRTEYSYIFPDRSSIQSYLKDVISRGIVVEVKELGSSVLYKKEKFDNRVLCSYDMFNLCNSTYQHVGSTAKNIG
ncbi:hypothetical protein CTEN210_11284 [Chaetoceros tenuissimus]|uniref:NYN domain-containing protein n=1 Tax=Chaetoceros tenuissimus TaxID=426638 RepID=A0AAD3CZD0_9STRA|nr:hypothetical protein CTEN210_11284 [Chaetoceros tenuissimus]